MCAYVHTYVHPLAVTCYPSDYWTSIDNGLALAVALLSARAVTAGLSLLFKAPSSNTGLALVEVAVQVRKASPGTMIIATVHFLTVSVLPPECEFSVHVHSIHLQGTPHYTLLLDAR